MDSSLTPMEKIVVPVMKYNFQGVFREPVSHHVVHEVLNVVGDKYAIVCEMMDTPQEHFHFIVQSDRKITLFGLRASIKAAHPPDIVYQNGVLNISKCLKTREQCIYMTKEVIPQIKHGYEIGLFEKLQKYSYKKKEKSMTREVAELKELLKNDLITVIEYVVQYRLIRLKHKNPDPNWQKEAFKALGMRSDEKKIREEVEKFFSYQML